MFGEVLHGTGLSRRAAYRALQRMMEEETVFQATKRGPYELHGDLLTSQDLKAILGAEETRRLLLQLDAQGERVSRIRGNRMRQSALALFLMWNLSFIAAYTVQIFLGLSAYEDGSVNEKLLKKFMWSHLEPWLGMLNSICFHNRRIFRQPATETGKEFMDLGTKNFVQYQKLLFPSTG